MSKHTTDLAMALDAIGASQTEFAVYLRVTDRTMRRWVSGEVAPPPDWPTLLLRWAIAKYQYKQESSSRGSLADGS